VLNRSHRLKHPQQEGAAITPTEIRPVSTTTTTPGPEPRAAGPSSLGSSIARVVGFALQAVAAVFVAASGLMMPMWAVLVMWLVWLTGLAIQIVHRRRPLVVVAVPIVVTAIWVLTGTLGETYLGWTA
jgi:hypothetical protein